MPTMIEGTPFSTSAVNLIKLPKRFRPYSARYTPAPIPMGTPTRLAIARIKAVPAIALAIPPPTSPTGLGVWVRKAQLMEPTPLYNRYPKMAHSGASTTITDPAAANVANPFTARRYQLIGAAPKESTLTAGFALAIGPRRCATSYCPDQNLRQDIDDDGHDEQRQSHLHQRAQIEVSRCLAEFVGDDTRHGVSRREE